MRVSGVGCCVADILYDLPPGQDRLAPWLSRASDDGGIVRGGAVLKRALERRTGMPFDAWLAQELAGVAPRRSLGGVCVVTLIAAAQLLPPGEALVEFHACLAEGPEGDWILGQIARTPLGRGKLRRRRGRAPTTVILNEHMGGVPERSFLTEPGLPSSLALGAADLAPDFFTSDVAVFSCMQWEGKLFADLTSVVARSKRAGALTVLGTAFDPSCPSAGGRWPLGDSDEVYRYLDVLVADRTEALMYSGEPSVERAWSFFRRSGVGALVVTDGLEPVHYWSSGVACAAAEGQMPVVQALLDDQARGALPRGDTVGCGDNFAGGVVASLALQRAGGGRVDLEEAVRLGNLSGAVASTHSGGVYYERIPGERRALVERYRAAYAAQLGRRA